MAAAGTRSWGDEDVAVGFGKGVEDGCGVGD